MDKIDVNASYRCPGCDELLFRGTRRCSRCEQKIQWQKIDVPVPLTGEETIKLIVTIKRAPEY